MAKYTGAVRFSDGALRYFVYDGTTDSARRALFASELEADGAWDLPMGNDKSRVAAGDLEVQVMPYFCHGDCEVAFCSTASQDRSRLTGALSFGEAYGTSQVRSGPFIPASK